MPWCKCVEISMLGYGLDARRAGEVEVNVLTQEWDWFGHTEKVRESKLYSELRKIHSGCKSGPITANAENSKIYRNRPPALKSTKTALSP